MAIELFQNQEIPQGWPLGLGNMNMRYRAGESSQAGAAEQQYSLHRSSSSFSSFSSSNLDTESTASFFQDQSVSLGRLIGIRPGNRGNLYFPNAIRFDQHQIVAKGRRSSSEVSEGGHGVEMSQGLCVPLLHNVIEKMSRCKSSSRQ